MSRKSVHSYMRRCRQKLSWTYRPTPDMQRASEKIGKAKTRIATGIVPRCKLPGVGKYDSFPSFAGNRRDMSSRRDIMSISFGHYGEIKDSQHC